MLFKVFARWYIQELPPNTYIKIKQLTILSVVFVKRDEFFIVRQREVKKHGASIKGDSTLKDLAHSTATHKKKKQVKNKSNKKKIKYIAARLYILVYHDEITFSSVQFWHGILLAI